MNNFLTQKAYIVGVHHYAFRSGEVAEIIGVKHVKPEGSNLWRLSYEIKYDDGVIDYVCQYDIDDGNYVVVTDLELAKGRVFTKVGKSSPTYIELYLKITPEGATFEH